MSKVRPQPSALGFVGFVSLLVLAAIVTAPKARAGEIETGAAVTTEVTSVSSGGVDRGISALTNIDLSAHWQGDNGWEAYGYIIGDFGDNLAEHRVGDYQMTSNIEAPEGVRLMEAYVKKSWNDGRISLAAGVVNLNAVFDVQDVGGLFLNNSFGVAPDHSQVGLSIFPFTSLGVIGQWQVAENHHLRLGVFDGVTGEYEKRFTWLNLSQDEGAHVLAEYEFDFDGGALKLGKWQSTGLYERLDGTGQTRGVGGQYAHLAMTLTHEADEAQGLQAWIRAGGADKNTMTTDIYAGGGLVYTGALPGRDDDQLGFAVASAHFGNPYKASVNAYLEPEVAYELTYSYVVRDGLSIQPDFQYVQNPFGRSDIDNAVLFTLRLKADLMALR